MKSPNKKVAKKTGKKTASKTAKATDETAAAKKSGSSAGSAKPTSKAGKKKSTSQQNMNSADSATSQSTSAAAKTGRRKETPAVFKIRKHKHTPIAFSLDEVREVLEERKKSGRTVEDIQKESASDDQPTDQAAKKKVVSEEQPTEARSFSAASLADILGYNPNEEDGEAITEKQKAEEEARVPKKFIKYYRALAELRDHVRADLNEHTQDTLHRSAKDDSGDLSSYGQHQADAGTETFDRDFALNLLSNEQDELYEIEEAISRIFDGTYGICEQTGKPIAKERLTAVPWTRFSVEGQREFERNKRRKVERGGVFTDTGEDGPKIEEPEE